MVEIKIGDVSKVYDSGFKKNIVFKNINMTLKNDKIHFLIGPNGCGKSTLIKCILNLINYEGKIDISSTKIAYAPEKLIMPDYLKVNQFLLTLLNAKHQNINDIEIKMNNYLKLFTIENYANTNLHKLSKGTKQKINLLQALLEEADIYIFDEPLSGLDTESKKVFKELVYELKKKEKLIIISTHHLRDYRFRNKNIIEMGNENVRTSQEIFTE